MSTVRCWQTDSAHALKRGDTSPSLWAVPHGITVAPERGHTATWAVQMVLSCQRARATEKE